MIFFLIVGIVILLIWVGVKFYNGYFVTQIFKGGNILVFGRKGHGKDVLFNYVIWKRRKEKYFANIDYGYKYNHCVPKDLELKNNSYDNFINGDVKQELKNPEFEGHDVYFSDIGVILPSYFDSQLKKKYPSFPIVYALSRHLYNMNIHCNTQAFSRPWLLLREQADKFILCKKCVHLPFFLRVIILIYEKKESAECEKEPFKSVIFNKQAKALKKQYEVENGVILKKTLYIPKKVLKYDSRAYHEILFNEKAPTK